MSLTLAQWIPTRLCDHAERLLYEAQNIRAAKKPRGEYQRIKHSLSPRAGACMSATECPDAVERDAFNRLYALEGDVLRALAAFDQ